MIGGIKRGVLWLMAQAGELHILLKTSSVQNMTVGNV